MGGKFNGNLRGRPGWIFQKAKEAELMQFIGQANQGLVQPTPQTTTTYTTATATAQPQLQMVPFGVTAPAMTPQAAMARLTIAQPVTPMPTATVTPTQPMIPTPLPQITPMIPTPQVLAPQIPTPQVAVTQMVKPLSPKPVATQPAQPLTVAFPNFFTAADGLTYQIIIYTAPVPEVGQQVTLTVGDTNLEYTVTAIQKTAAPIDDILITQVLPEGTPEGTEAQTSRAIIMNGKWQVHCMQDDHTLTFHARQQ
jgi:hypothetical protein